MRKIIIAIDGHSSTGKSTLAFQLADYLSYNYIDTGSMYRAVTLFALQNNCIEDKQLNAAKLISNLDKITLHFEIVSGKSTIFLNGKNVAKEIRTIEVSSYVSPVATVSEVRRKLVKQQQLLGKDGGIVMDGRDIGTVVFPKAHLKIFMTAAPEVRAQRRFNELLSRGDSVTYNEVFQNVIERDKIDSSRKDSPLKIAEDAIVLDNSEMTIEDQFHIILQLAKDRIAGRV